MKTFKGDFDLFLNKVKTGENFSVSRWGDGELAILEGNQIDLRAKANGEFYYDPNILEHDIFKQKMLKAYKHKQHNYYIGVACKCCVGDEKFEYMKKLSEQNVSNLTWANIFVNSNYKYFIDSFIPEMKNKRVILVANKKSDVSNLPFTINKFYGVGTNAWMSDYNLTNEIKEYIINNNIKNTLFLFAAGPFANTLCYELFKDCPENTYIDIGSTLDVILGLGATRRYLRGADTLQKECVW